MNRGQLIAAILVYLWFAAAAALACLALANSFPRDGLTAAGIFSFFTLVLLTPAAVGVIVWQWLGDRGRSLGSFFGVAVSPFAAALVAGLGAFALAPDGGSRPVAADDCNWIWSNESQTSLTFSAPVRQRDGFGFVGPGQRGPQRIFETSVKSTSERPVTLSSYGVRLLSDDGQPVGEYFVSVGYPRPLMRSGYVEDVRVAVPAREIPAIASEDSAWMGVRYCHNAGE